MKKWQSRKWIAAIFSACFAIAAFVVFTINIKEPNAGLLLSVVVAPNIGVVCIVCGVQGLYDHKYGEGTDLKRNDQ